MGRIAVNRESQPVAQPLKLTNANAFALTPESAANALESPSADVSRPDPKDNDLLAQHMIRVEAQLAE
jgi:hypothetical protein